MLYMVVRVLFCKLRLLGKVGQRELEMVVGEKLQKW